MKLKGKAKKDFKLWYNKRLSVMTKSELLNINDELIYNALIIEFFDSCGYYILPCIKNLFGYLLIIDGDDYPIKENHLFDNRNEAINEAIKVTTNIYNDGENLHLLRKH